MTRLTRATGNATGTFEDQSAMIAAGSPSGRIIELYDGSRFIVEDDDQGGILLSTNNYANPLAGGGGGESNTSSNSGAGEGLALAKVGFNLPFKSLVAGTNVTIDSGADTLTINATLGGSGVDSFNGRSGVVVPVASDYTPAFIGAATSAQGATADSALQTVPVATDTTFGGFKYTFIGGVLNLITV